MVRVQLRNTCGCVGMHSIVFVSEVRNVAVTKLRQRNANEREGVDEAPRDVQMVKVRATALHSSPVSWLCCDILVLPFPLARLRVLRLTIMPQASQGELLCGLCWLRACSHCVTPYVLRNPAIHVGFDGSGFDDLEGGGQGSPPVSAVQPMGSVRQVEYIDKASREYGDADRAVQVAHSPATSPAFADGVAPPRQSWQSGLRCASPVGADADIDDATNAAAGDGTAGAAYPMLPAIAGEPATRAALRNAAQGTTGSRLRLSPLQGDNGDGSTMPGDGLPVVEQDLMVTNALSNDSTLAPRRGADGTAGQL